jgi:hypothetical protein
MENGRQHAGEDLGLGRGAQEIRGLREGSEAGFGGLCVCGFI